MIPAPEYLPIADYGAIGNLRTVALVGRNGSVDWCCFPHLDSPSVFGALLDRRQGGRFRVSPAAGDGQGRQRYWPATNVLETTFEAPGGRLIVVDWMPLSGDIDGCGKSVGEPALCRQLSSVGGPVEVDLVWSPRPGYARSAPEIRRAAGGVPGRGPRRGASGAGRDISQRGAGRGRLRALCRRPLPPRAWRAAVARHPLGMRPPGLLPRRPDRQRPAPGLGA